MALYTDQDIERSYQDLDLHQAVSCMIYGHSTNRQDIRDFALQSVDFSRVKNILDLGCGFGFSTLGFQGKIQGITHIVGIDIQETYQKPFLHTCDSIGAIGEFHTSDVAELATYPPHSFDLVFSCFSLYFFPDAVRDIARVLTDDGTFVAITHSEETLRELIRHIPPTLESLGLGVPELLSIQKLLRTFSCESGEDLLRPSFGEIGKKIFRNSLRFQPEEMAHLRLYLHMKKHLFLKEVCEVNPDSVGAVLNQLTAALTAEARVKGTLEFNKNDAAFICRKPMVAREERPHPSSARHCMACGFRLVEKKIEGRRRAICTECGFIVYENPLPVAAAVVVDAHHRVLLVRRARHPMKGMWCLPCGFAEKDESIEDAVLRELQEETHLTGRVKRLLDAVTARNYFYGNLVMISFEITDVQGIPVPGDDTDAVRFFPIGQTPPLAFPCQEQAVEKYRER
ncbi:MAG: NUDIX domain-containing protein [Deferrisomatales bacterium]|nr:NUDIX domain-containing protein [Deferrisomatales bacterium]